MNVRVVNTFAVLCLFGVSTLSVYVLQSAYNTVQIQKESSVSEVNSRTATEVSAISRKSEAKNPVIKLLEDVMSTSAYKNGSKCQQLDRTARQFTMSQDFENNITEFLSAVRERFGRDFTIWLEKKSMYKLLQYLTSKLKFVRTVCETGIYNLLLLFYLEDLGM